MEKRVVIIGGSIGGLAVALGLARRGWSPMIVERDPGPDTESGDDAFVVWNRRNVPQFHQPHGFSSRTRNLLLEHAPEVVERLRADGVDTTNFFKLLAPPELWTEEDDKFDGLMVRRPGFELALRRTAEAEPRITFLCPANVTGLTLDAAAGSGAPAVTGIRLDDGTDLPADVVIDCGGRRTLVPGWLGHAGVHVPFESQDCDVTYYTRYFRLLPDSPMAMFMVITVNTDIPGAVQLLGFPGDNGAFGVCLATMGGDEELRDLRRNDAWEAVLGLFPSVQPWVAPTNATPVNDVQVMAGSRNIRRRYVVDGKPIVRGLLPVGDSLCATNPTYGWGASMALTYAFAAVDAITSHANDPVEMALAYDRSIALEADGVYRESAAMDRLRIYTWRGIEIPDDDRDEMDRQDLIARGVGRGARRDPVLGRAFLRRTNLLDRPDEVLDDPDVLERAIATRAYHDAKAKATTPGQPTRADVLAAIASIQATAGVAST